MLTKEEIKKKLEEDPSWTLSDDATDEEWDSYLEVKDEMGGSTETDDSWDDMEESSEEADEEI